MMEFTDANFETEVLGHEKPVLVDFWAPWCGPCRMVGPVVEEIGREMEDQLRVGKVNVDQNQKFAAQFGITGIPTLLLFKDGKLADRWVGARNKAQLKPLIEQHL